MHRSGVGSRKQSGSLAYRLTTGSTSSVRNPGPLFAVAAVIVVAANPRLTQADLQRARVGDVLVDCPLAATRRMTSSCTAPGASGPRNAPNTCDPDRPHLATPITIAAASLAAMRHGWRRQSPMLPHKAQRKNGPSTVWGRVSHGGAAAVQVARVTAQRGRKPSSVTQLWYA
jgi:hypothetical protein